MKKERKRLNRKLVAFILVLSMIFGQAQAVFATESGNTAAPAQPVVEEPAAPVEGQTEPANPGDVKTPADPAVTDSAQPTDGQAPTDQAENPSGDAAAPADPKTDVSEDKAETPAVSEDKTEVPAVAEPENEENAASGNAASDNRISLSGGSISVNILSQSDNTLPNYYKVSENVFFSPEGTKEKTAVSSDKMVGMNIGFDFKVVSDNASNNTVLKENEDYTVKWYYTYKKDQSGNVIPEGKRITEEKTKEFVADDEGTITVKIEAVDGSGYKNWISLTVEVAPKPTIKPFVKGDLEVKISNNIITVSNNTSDRIMFFDLVKEKALTLSESLVPTSLEPKKSMSLVAYYREGGVKKTVTTSMNIAVVASTDYYFNSDQKQVYEVVAVYPGSGSNGYEDGYKEINMKAYVDKASQLIKISWAPDSKKGFKTFELQRMNEKGEFEILPDWKDSKGSTKLTKKNYSYKYNKNNKEDDGIERGKKPAVFLLKCYDAAGTETKYITVAAPSLLYVEPSYDNNSMEFCFSMLKTDPGLSYKLEVAEKKVENGQDAVGKRGFAQTEKYDSEVASESTFDIPDFLIKKGLSVNASREDFMGNNEFKLETGTQYYCRVKSAFWYKGKQYISAPSNVLSRKAGPSKTYVFDVNGVRYERPTGRDKATIEEGNKKRMYEYLNAWLKDETVSSDIFTHMDNQGPDAKSGYIVFLREKDKDNTIKSYELLRSDTQYGTYKKLKAYNLDKAGNPANNSGLAKFEIVGSDLLKDYDIYYMWYNNFPPEKTYYYAVRAVSRAGGAQGGFGDGYESTAQLDKVSKLYPLDGKVNKINLYWKHDDCVKKYKIYRTEGEKDKEPTFDPSDTKWTLIGTANGGKSGTLKESDKDLKSGEKKELYEATSGNLVGDYNKYIDRKKVETGHVYYYAIVPIYDLKNKDPKYNIDKVSDPEPGVATLNGVKVKNFKAGNGGVHKINTSWTKISNDPNIEYMIIRSTELPANKDDKVQWLTLWLEKGGVMYDKAGQNETRPVVYITKDRVFKDTKAKVGQQYYYAIFAGDFPDTPTKETVDSLSDLARAQAKSLPLAPASVTLTKSDYRNGAVVTFTKNPADRDDWGNITYTVKGVVNGAWEEIGSIKGTSGAGQVTDPFELPRGVERRYQIIPSYNDGSGAVSGGARDAGVYSKPNKVEPNGNTNISVGEESKISVYAKCGGNVATLRGIGYSSSGGISVTQKTEGDHTVFVVKGTSRGTAKLEVWAEGYDSYTGGSSRSDLRKTITFNIR